MNIIKNKGIGSELDSNEQTNAHSNFGGMGVGAAGMEYWRAFLAFKHILLVIALIAAAIGWLYGQSQPQLYSATGTILVQPDRSTLKENSEAFFGDIRWYEAQQEIISSPEVADRVARKLHLAENNDLFPRNVEHEKHPVAKKIFDYMNNGINNVSFLFKKAKSVLGLNNSVEAGAEKDAQSISSIHNQWIRFISNGVSVYRSGNSRSTPVLKVSFISQNPELATIVVNAVMDEYIGLMGEDNAESAVKTRDWLKERVDEANVEVARVQAQLENMRGRSGSSQDVALSESRLGLYEQDLAIARRNFEELSSRYGARHPKIISARTELDLARQNYVAAEARLRQSSQAAEDVSKIEEELRRKQDEAYQLEQQLKTQQISTDTRTRQTRVLERAVKPSAPFSPNIARTVLMASVGGLLAAAALLLIREQYNRNIKSGEQLEKQLGYPVLGVVPLLQGISNKKKSYAERYYTLNRRSGFSESINHLRTSIMYSGIDDSSIVIVVTSALMSEGKTTIAANLAQAFGEIGRSLLLECDLRKPRVGEIAKNANGMDNLPSIGLSNFLNSSAELKDCIYPDSVAEDFYYMPCGTIPQNPQELLFSYRFQNLVNDKLRRYFRFIIIDAPPVLPVSDSIVLGNKVANMVIFAVKTDSTPVNIVREAVKRMQLSDVVPSGMVLTQFDDRKIKRYGYGNYGYYGGYYGGEYYGSYTTDND